MNTTKYRRGRGSSSSSRNRSSSHSRPQGRGFHSGNRFSGRGRSRPQGGRRGGKKATFDPSQFINTNPVERVEEVYAPKNSFNSFALSSELQKNIVSAGLTTPTPIQDQIIPHILEKRDVIGLAETGTGKTAAFLIPLVQASLTDTTRKTLILAPTRELALQIEGELRKLARGMHIFSTVCVGGVNIRPQIKNLGRRNHFIIGTPGRVIDLMDRKLFKPETISTVVLDEADRMLDMGFIGDMRKVLSAVPKKSETLFFSATMDATTKNLVNEFLDNPVVVSVKKKDVIDSIEQNVIPYRTAEKFETLVKLLSQEGMDRVLIFGAMKHSVERLARELSKSGVKAESIHGNKNHSQRQRALNNFKEGKARVLVATDVAARGIHVNDVSHVINYDLPTTFEDYVHRIGRTGRASKRGKALTFVAK